MLRGYISVRNVETAMDGHNDDTARQGRIIAITIAIAGVLAIAAPWLTTALGLAPKFEILFYLISLAAFIWSLVVTWKLWQKTRS
ncbi:DUF5337 family protein [Yoonia sp. R2331]|uniref:DUF5337 family protein n=1 Tax=Yoonia sp. R2331 TaxID=3237238 RepID=UPI0034E42681